ncbi:MAG: 30S ribosomal protein S6 [Oscillospiraceae bacterium]|nr:30S ribosomal protein S6 [Oscillospiraceae bacterium]
MYKAKISLKTKYESVIVFSTKKGEKSTSDLVEKFRDLISSSADLDSVEEWGKRELVYPINKESEGCYVLFNFTSSAEFPRELDRICRITAGVLRFLIVRRVLKPPAPENSGNAGSNVDLKANEGISQHEKAVLSGVSFLNSEDATKGNKNSVDDGYGLEISALREEEAKLEDFAGTGNSPGKLETLEEFEDKQSTEENKSDEVGQ